MDTNNRNPINHNKQKHGSLARPGIDLISYQRFCSDTGGAEP
jgi:hypothetical protein